MELTTIIKPLLVAAFAGIVAGVAVVTWMDVVGL